MNLQTPIGINQSIAAIHQAAEQPARTPAPVIVTIDSKEHGKVDVQIYPEPKLWVQCRLGRAFTADSEMREVKLSCMDEAKAIGTYNRVHSTFEEEEQENKPCSDPDGHDWRCVGEASDGTTFYKCYNCPLEYED